MHKRVKHGLYDCVQGNSGQFARMSWCSEWIRDWLRKSGGSQTELANLGKVDPANVSRWLSDQSKPDREAVAGFVGALPLELAAEFLVAWLKDSLPDGAANLVRIEVAMPIHTDDGVTLRDETAKYGEPLRHFPPGMSEDLQERLLFFGKLAIENPDVRKILDICYQAMKRAGLE